MSSVTLQDLLEAGAHFGHQTKRWNPKMKRFILTPKNGIYIIDLNKTVTQLDKFIDKVRAEVQRGGRVLFVATKKQLKDSIREEALRCNMPYVTERWLGGMLTNFQTIRKSVAKLEKIETMEKDGTFEALPKKERLDLIKHKEKLLSVLSGIRDMRKLPGIVFVVDTTKEHIAITEGKRLGIPIGAIVDTNCDPDAVDFPIPGNDDAIKSVQLITKAIVDTILEVNPAITKEELAAAEEAKAAALKLEEEGGEAEEEVTTTDEAGKVVKKRKVVHKKITRFTEEE